MNKYQKAKSRQIKAIMRSDPWKRTSYKEAKRKWRKGTRVWDITYTALPTDMMNEIIKFCNERKLEFRYYYDRCPGDHVLKFLGRTVDGGRYGIEHRFSGESLFRYRGASTDFIRRVLCEVNHRLREFIFPKVNIREWEPTDVESIFGKLIDKEVTTNA